MAGTDPLAELGDAFVDTCQDARYVDNYCEVHCIDCDLELMPDTPPGSHDWQRYMVTDEVWAAAGMEPAGGWLCIPCLEARLGRPLTGYDFPADIPLNHPFRRWSTADTPRLQHLKLQAALKQKRPIWKSEYEEHLAYLRSRGVDA